MTMREKLEHVLAEPSTWDRLDPAHRDALRNKANAILAALEEPTEAMLRSGWGKMIAERAPIQDVWRAMIGAAKGEG